MYLYKKYDHSNLKGLELMKSMKDSLDDMSKSDGRLLVISIYNNSLIPKEMSEHTRDKNSDGLLNVLISKVRRLAIVRPNDQKTKDIFIKNLQTRLKMKKYENPTLDIEISIFDTEIEAKKWLDELEQNEKTFNMSNTSYRRNGISGFDINRVPGRR